MLLSAAWSKEFSLRHPIIYVLYGIVLAFVISLSLYYMLTAIKHAKQLGIESSKIKKVITTSATFSILPGLGIALGVVTLVGTLGVAFPAIRLSVVGSLQYETQMATAVGFGFAEKGITPDAATEFATMAMIMTIAICSGGVEVLFFYRLYQPKIGKLMAKTTGGAKKGGVNIGDLVFQVSFIGMVIGYLAMSIETLAHNVAFVDGYYNFIAVLVAMGCMYVCDVLINKANWKWLDSFSTPLSMLFAMFVVGVISYCANKYGWALSPSSSAAAEQAAEAARNAFAMIL